MEENQYVVIYFPKNMTDQFQPINLTVNGPAKGFLKEIFETWCANQVTENLPDQCSLEELSILKPIKHAG